MDCFIKITNEKKVENRNTIHINELKTLKEYVTNNENIFICGAAGTGKTHLLNVLCADINYIHIESFDIKNGILDFVQNTKKHIIIEDYTNDNSVLKKFIESVSDGYKPTEGSVIITTDQHSIYPNFKNVYMEPKSPEILLSIVDQIDDYDHALEMAKISNGNIHNFLHYLTKSDTKDTFKTSSEYITDLLCKSQKIEIIDYVSEHGHIWDVFQENYANSKNVNLVACSDSFSITDIFDVSIYKGEWELMPYFVLNSITFPKFYMNGLLNENRIRPGKSWTKYGNYKMRLHRLKEILTESNKNITIDELSLLKKYAERGNINILMEYNISPQKFDIINHLSLESKLKPKDVTKIKKSIKELIDSNK